jgi:tetratricopeptide (TPR) repeat protein
MQALKINPEDVFTCLYFGTLLTFCDDKKFAMELFEHAVFQSPDLSVVHWCKAKLHKSLGEFDLAEYEYERAVEVEPDDEQAQEKLADWRVFISGKRRGLSDDNS